MTKRINGGTREGQEDEVIGQVLKHGGFSVFWATAHQKRAHAIERLQNTGRIVRDGGDYPWCAYHLAVTNTPANAEPS